MRLGTGGAAAIAKFGLQAFTTRGPITSKVLKELRGKIQRERDGLELLGSAANKQFATLVQTGGKRQLIATNQGQAAKALRTMRAIGRLPSGVRPERPCELCESLDVVEQSVYTLPST